MKVADGSGQVAQVSSAEPLATRRWYLVSGSYDAASGELSEHYAAFAQTESPKWVKLEGWRLRRKYQMIARGYRMMKDLV